MKVETNNIISVSEYAKTFKGRNKTGVSPAYIYKLIEKGIVKSIKIGEQVYVNKAG
jgi:hypothetical protein